MRMMNFLKVLYRFKKYDFEKKKNEKFFASVSYGLKGHFNPFALKFPWSRKSAFRFIYPAMNLTAAHLGKLVSCCRICSRPPDRSRC